MKFYYYLYEVSVDNIKEMFFSVFIVIVSLTSLNAQTVVSEVKLSNSQDVTHLRFEYYKGSNGLLETNSISYSLWKGKQILFVAKVKYKWFSIRSTSRPCVPNLSKIWSEF